MLDVRLTAAEAKRNVPGEEHRDIELTKLPERLDHAIEPTVVDVLEEDLPAQAAKKGDYLLPINIVMPGDWEVRLTVLKEGKVIFRGSYQFDV